MAIDLYAPQAGHPLLSAQADPPGGDVPQSPDEPAARYAAFISYSHADQTHGRWLHKALETFRLPRALVGTDSPFGPVPRRLPPVFRDRDELPASGDLGTELRGALAASRFQIVICSRRAATSKWVNEEILSFKRVHGESRTLALIVDGEPYAGGDMECFPPALRFRLAPDGTLSDDPAEPIAADLRPGKDGKRLALLKLIAGVTGLRLDALVRRDAARRQQRLVLITALSLAVSVVTIGLAIYAESQRRVAETQRRMAERSLDFLVGTFAIANPATENPRTITAITILDRASQRAAAELRDEPGVSARLLQTTGDIYYNLGLPKESERDLRAALALQPEKGEPRARLWLRLAALAYKRGDARGTKAAVAEAITSYEPTAPYGPELDALATEQTAMAAFLEGKYADAAQGLGLAAARFAAVPGDQRDPLGRIWINQAHSLVRLRRFAEADQLYRQTIEAYTGRYGTNHLFTADAYRNQAWGDFEAGRLAEAERHIGRAIAIYDRVLAGDHPTIGAALILTGRIRTARGDGAGALQALDKARTLFARLYGPRNAAVGDVDFFAAEAESRRGDMTAALARAASTKAIYDEAYGPDDPDQAELLLLRARIYTAGGKPVEARAACAAGLALKTKLDPKDPTLAETRRNCGG